MGGGRGGVKMEKIEGWERARKEKIGEERSMDGNDERREGGRKRWEKERSDDENDEGMRK